MYGERDFWVSVLGQLPPRPGPRCYAILLRFNSLFSYYCYCFLKYHCPCADPTDLNLYRPISNLPFISKTLERVVAAQLQSHLVINNIHEPFQSGFRPKHSTETALVKINSDLLCAADSGLLTTLILLDLSTAFDTISHTLLLDHHRHTDLHLLQTHRCTKILVYSFVNSCIDYCNALLTGFPTKLINRLQTIQNSTARISTRTKSFDHITPILILLYWLPVQYHIHYKNVLITYKVLHHLAPTYLCNLLHEYSPSRTLRSTSAGLLTIPTPQYHGCPSLQLLGTQTMELSPPTH